MGARPQLRETTTQRSRGFTLIEILAVVTIFALLAGLLAPRVGSVTGRNLVLAAERISTRIDLARQRAALTGIPHRLLVDIDGGSYRIEWRVTEARQLGVEPEPEPELDVRGQTPIPMTPPTGEQAEFRPLPGIGGRFEPLAASVFFSGVETSEGFQDRGEATIEFDYDGTGGHTSLYLDDDSGRTLILDVLPLADGVRIHEAS
jgi:prepilin-type N-terminal cleavage/methylation domain-containing protein